MPNIFQSTKGSAVFCSVSGPSGSITADGSFRTMLFQTVAIDRLGNYNPSTGLYTVTEPGDYLWYASFSDSDAGHQTDNLSRCGVAKNDVLMNVGAASITLDSYCTASSLWMDSFAIGDTISSKYYITWGSNTVTSFGPCTMVIVKLS